MPASSRISPSALLAVLALGLLCVGGCCAAHAASATWVTVDVLDHSLDVRSTGGKQPRTYRVNQIVTAGEVFDNEDSLLFGKWRSEELQGRITPGRRYRLRVSGWRVGILGWHRNVIEAQEEPDAR